MWQPAPLPPIHLPYSHQATTDQAKLWLYWLKTSEQRYRRLSANIIREVCLYIGSRLILPAINGNLLRLLDLERGGCVDVDLKRRFTSGTVFCLLPSTAIIAIGGSFASSSVSCVTFPDFSIRSLSSLLRPRTRPGLYVSSTSIYLFGGRNGVSMTSCESLLTLDSQWRYEVDMFSPKSAFWPCEYAGEIYLCDPNENGDCLEAFSIAKRAIRTFPCVLTSSSLSSVACIYADELIIALSSGDLMRIDLKTVTVREGNIGYLAGFKADSNVLPIRAGRRLYWVRPDNGSIQVLDVVSKAMEVLGG